GLRVEEALHQTLPPAQDAKEYLPAGYPQRSDAAYGDLSLGLLRDVPAISCLPAARLCRAETTRFGGMQIDIAADTPTQAILKRFWFPGWRLGDAIVPAAGEPLRLVTFALPAGSLSAPLHRIALPEEKVGWAVSGLSLALLLMWIAVERRRKQP
ncbi:MAG: hypothetical protein Q8K85_22295, partial [Hyphomicrobium sp.]|nr:hypothetical protein [Hyphomicrobium sp.]